MGVVGVVIVADVVRGMGRVVMVMVRVRVIGMGRRHDDCRWQVLLKEVLEAPCRMCRLAEMRLLMPTGVARYAAVVNRLLRAEEYQVMKVRKKARKQPRVPFSHQMFTRTKGKGEMEGLPIVAWGQPKKT